MNDETSREPELVDALDRLEAWDVAEPPARLRGSGAGRLRG